MPWAQPAGHRHYKFPAPFLVVDLAPVTDHNPQLRLVLTLAGRQFRTSDGNPL